MLEFKNVFKQYQAGKFALKNVSFKINEGEIVAVIGSSGAGKSTLLRCINRLIDFEKGSVFFCGKDIKAAKYKELRAMRSNIGMVFQSYNLVERLSAIENVLHGRLGKMSCFRGVFGMYTAAEKTDALALLEEVGLSSYAFQRCDQLSGGQKQRIGIARALMQQPKLLLCDEPIASLDPKSAETVLDYIKKTVSARALSCIINLHQIDFAKKYAGRIIALREGEIVFNGKPEELNSKSLLEEIFADTSKRV